MSFEQELINALERMQLHVARNWANEFLMTGFAVALKDSKSWVETVEMIESTLNSPEFRVQFKMELSETSLSEDRIEILLNMTYDRVKEDLVFFKKNFEHLPSDLSKVSKLLRHTDFVP